MSIGVGTPPFDEDIFAMPLIPTKLYPRYDGGNPSKTSRTSCDPTVNDEPGEEWSTPPASKVTPSKAQRIGQSTFQTSFPLSVSDNAKPPSWLQSHRYRICVLASSKLMTTVESRSQTSQYGRYG
ncbi:hypothetical protein BG452_00915 [Streptomyces sp. CBMA123]|nr:hypothetical protein [Streptomyces sp. CBMA123]